MHEDDSGVAHDSTMLHAVGILLLGIVFIWIAVNVIEPTQGIMQLVSDNTATAMNTTQVTPAYTPDYTILFIVPAAFSFLYLYIANKKKQEEFNNGQQEIIPYRG